MAHEEQINDSDVLCNLDYVETFYQEEKLKIQFELIDGVQQPKILEHF
jgi:hypothetical protein